MRDPETRIRDGKIQIRDKHPGSAKLQYKTHHIPSVNLFEYGICKARKV